MDFIIDHLLFASFDSENRIRDIIKDKIEKKELQSFPIFEKGRNPTVEKRKRQIANKEAVEAEELFKDIQKKRGISSIKKLPLENTEDSLKQLIQQKSNSKSSQNFVNYLENKYTSKKTK